MTGPLSGYRFVEFAGVGPGPFAAMMLSDMGADVLRIDRPSAREDKADAYRFDVLNRGRESVALDLKTGAGQMAALRLVRVADGVIEGFRPGVMEKLGLGPEECLQVNPRLIYGRITGWGQSGPLAGAAGHDINYIALSGTLWMIGRRGQAPVPPLNLVGDFGGGGMLLAFGMMCALLEVGASGQGQVVDAGMVDGAALLATLIYGKRASGDWRDRRGENIVDTGAPWYDVYETKDGEYVSIGAIEPAFFALLLNRLGMGASDAELKDRRDRWPELRERFAAAFRTLTRQQWQQRLEGTDVCFAPVLSPSEATHHPHNVARQTFVTVGDILQPAPAPRFSRTAAGVPHPPHAPGVDTVEGLVRWGFDRREAEELQ